MRVKLISIAFPLYRLQHDNGHVFDVRGSYTEDGRFVFEPLEGWMDLEYNTQSPSESLYEDIDECIYNVTPEKYEGDV